MDLTIQSLVQSPYMRAMAVVPTKSEDLVHGIHDHMPPLVKTQVVVPYVRNPGVSGRWIFNIPRRGLWHSATLVLRPRGVVSATPAGMKDEQTNVVSTFVEAVENIELYSKQRFVERLMPEAIVSEMMSVAGLEEQWYQFTYSDVNPNDNTFQNSSVAWPDIGSVSFIGGIGTSNERKRPHYIIPLPLSCFTSIKKNFQTLFVENLSLIITTKPFGYANVTGYDMELHCEYHSFHPNVETVIRNANYKQSIPATLPWHDWIVFDNRISQSSNLVEYSLESDALISKLLVCFQWQHKSSGVKTYRSEQNFYIVVRSLSEILFQGSVGSLKHNYDLTLDETEAIQRHESIRHADSAYKYYVPITFGLRRDKERFTGGLALSSITNPRISIYANEALYRGSTSGALSYQFPSDVNYEAFDFKVLAKRHFFLRIDSDTGVITRSIES
jgi:hypothetical protein